MKIIIGSDFHKNYQLINQFTLNSLDENCLPIFCGDLVNRQERDLAEYTKITSDWLSANKNIIIVPGNHDPVTPVNNTGQLKLISRTINGEMKNILCIGGMPGDSGFWSFEYEENWLYNQLRKYLTTSIHIIVSHAPPYKLLDYDIGTHWGSKALRAYVELANVPYLFCGHVHEDEGRFKLKAFGDIKTQIVNSAQGITEIEI